LTAFVLVTGNPDKAVEAERILGYRPVTEALDLPELQSLDLEEVLTAKAREAWRRLRDAGRPSAVVVEETGLELSAMNGFPGPLVKWMLEAVGAEGVARAGLALGDSGVAAICALAYYDRPDDRDDDQETLVVASGRTDGTLTLPPRGDHGFGWDPVFIPEGENRTYAELAPEEKDALGHRGRAWRRFREALRTSGHLE
jgi:non-canonical purine NTP pyrophosphatase (RdgB/HAM1 family)